MTNRWICARCFTSSEEGVTACPNCGLERGAAPESAAGEVGTSSAEVGTSSAEVGTSSADAIRPADEPVAASAITPTEPSGPPVVDQSVASAERWVCLRCFASNDGSATTCSNCGLARGAEPAVGEAGYPSAAPGHTETSGGSRFPWRWVIYGVIALAVVGGSVLFAARRDDSGEISGAGDLSVFDLQVGDCFDVSIDATEVETVHAIPCDEPHIYELFWAGTYPSDVEPSASESEAWVGDQCDAAFAAYVGIDYYDSMYFWGYLSPTSEGWAGGDHEFSCYLYNASETAMSGSARGAAE